MYDTVAQYGQVLSGEVDDWHPPIMVRLWQQMHVLGGGAAPMFAVQAGLYVIGSGLIVGALVRTGRWRAGLAAATLFLSPLLLGWQMVVLKDAQMQGALVAAFGIAVHYGLAGRRIPVAVAAVVALLFVYATLVRANAVFATAPLIVLLLPGPRSVVARGLLIVSLVLVVLGITPLINHRLLAAGTSEVARTQPVFDLAAIAIAIPASASPFTPAELEQIRSRHCVKAFFWDPLGDPTACAPATERLMGTSTKELYLDLGSAILAHPLAYLKHRVEHWNSTERWLVPSGLPSAGPPIKAEPNDVGLGTTPTAVAQAWQDAAAAEAGVPAGWPVLWTIISLCLLPAAWRTRATPAGNLAFALLLSGLVLELSFFAVSIASDLRYHLWPLVSSPLALILLSGNLALKRGERWLAAACVVIVCVAGALARSSLPRAPASYQGMIHSASG